VELTRARLVEFLREPEAVFWVFIFPVLLAVALGIAFRTKPVEKLRAAVVRTDPAAERLTALLSGSADLAVSVVASADAAQALRSGKIDVIVEGSRDQDRRPFSVTFRYDTSRAEGRAARLAADDALQRALGRPDPLETREERFAQPGNRYIDFLIPGLVGLNLMGSGMWGLGFAVVQARTRKLLKRFAATPMRRSHYLLSFMFSRLVGLVLEVVVVVGFGWLLFGVAVRGSILDLAMVSLLGSLTFAGVGLLVAARPRTIEGVSGWMNLVQLPMWLLSGTFFSYERFPAAAHPFIRALPLTALNDALRAVINNGAPLVASWPAVAVMAVWGAASFALALKLFRWQ
jgi:ABC-type multidrug transport system permease subunit